MTRESLLEQRWKTIASSHEIQTVLLRLKHDPGTAAMELAESEFGRSFLRLIAELILLESRKHQEHLS